MSEQLQENGVLRADTAVSLQLKLSATKVIHFGETYRMPDSLGLWGEFRCVSVDRIFPVVGEAYANCEFRRAL